jgi:hypothetical protein
VSLRSALLVYHSQSAEARVCPLWSFSCAAVQPEGGSDGSGDRGGAGETVGRQDGGQPASVLWTERTLGLCKRERDRQLGACRGAEQLAIQAAGEAAGHGRSAEGRSAEGRSAVNERSAE